MGSSQNQTDETMRITLIHTDAETQRQSGTTVEISHSKTEESSARVECEDCNQEIEIITRPSSNLRLRFFILLLPSLVVGAYFITTRAINQGLETIILSLIIYTIFGFMLYLAVIYYIFGSWVSPVYVKNSRQHRVETE